MNKLLKILIAILGGIETTFYIFTPISLAALWIIVSGLNNWTSYFFYGIGLTSTLFRAIRIGWFKK